ncbi:MAG: protein kinase, partial [Anaerolineales bacterium]|nr:protein kinase [Anaerolineales bacterium]
MSDTLEGIVLGGKYKIIRRLGRGGMAEVYLAHQENLGRDVAIKLMHAFLVSEEDFLNRFKREARAMAAMNHPNIVGVYDFDVYGENTYYLVMEYISGGTLKDKLQELAKNEERLPLETAVQIGIEVASALDYAHHRSMIHRDVKPANIMLNDQGHAILTDFGIVKLVGGQSMAYTATGALIGTPAYMSPEQALGKPGDARSDIYSLGALLFQMVTGRLPFDADTPLAIVMQHVNDPVPIPATFNPDVPLGLQDVVLKALAKNPDDRYQSAGELVAALQYADLTGEGGGTAVPIFEPGAHRTAVMGTAVSNAAIDTKSGQISVTVPGDTAVAIPTEEAAKKRPYWLYGLVGIIIIAAIAAGVFGLFSGDDTTETTPIAAVSSAATTTPTLTATPQPTNTSPPTRTPDVDATVAMAIVLTEEAGRTATPTPSRTPTITATPSPTIDATTAYLANCTIDAELVVAYTYSSTRFTAAPVSSTFPANWTLRNSGTCPWPASLQWDYVEGEDFGYD